MQNSGGERILTFALCIFQFVRTARRIINEFDQLFNLAHHEPAEEKEQGDGVTLLDALHLS